MKTYKSFVNELKVFGIRVGKKPQEKDLLDKGPTGLLASRKDRAAGSGHEDRDTRKVSEEAQYSKAFHKKVREIADAIARENPNMPDDKKFAIATAQAKKSISEMKDSDSPQNRNSLAAKLRKLRNPKKGAGGRIDAKNIMFVRRNPNDPRAQATGNRAYFNTNNDQD